MNKLAVTQLKMNQIIVLRNGHKARVASKPEVCGNPIFWAFKVDIIDGPTRTVTINRLATFEVLT